MSSFPILFLSRFPIADVFPFSSPPPLTYSARFRIFLTDLFPILKITLHINWNRIIAWNIGEKLIDN